MEDNDETRIIAAFTFAFQAELAVKCYKQGNDQPTRTWRIIRG